MNAVLGLLALPLLGGLFGTSEVATQDEPPSIRELVNGPPMLYSESEKVKSLEVEGAVWLCDEVQMNYHIAYVAPDQFRMELSDARDGVPLVLLSQREYLLYDPVHGAVIHLDQMNAHCVVARPGRKLLCGVFCSNTREPKSFILLHFASVLEPSLLQRWGDSVHKAEPVGRDVLRVTRRRGRTSIIADFDRRNPSVVRDFEVLNADGQPGLGFRVTRISVNEPIRSRPFRFPSLAELETRIPVIDLPGKTFKEAMQAHPELPLHGKILDLWTTDGKEVSKGLSDAMMGCAARAAAKNPERLKAVVRNEPLDLKAVAENDRRLAPVLRQLTAPAE